MMASFVPVALAAAFATANVAPIESVSLHARNGTHLVGTISYHAAGNGTAVSLRLTGAAPGTSIRVLFQAGSCAHHGASFALAGSGRASSAGTLSRHGRVLFHGQPVGIGIVADGKHVFTVVFAGAQQACAPIPGMS
jgi:hypothetical protein